MAKKPDSDLIPASGAPQGLAPAPDWAEKGSAGLENLRASDLAWPRLVLMQKTSKLLDVDRNLRAGMAILDLTKELYADVDVELEIVPCAHFLSWIEWRGVDEGGGIVRASMDSRSPVAMDAARGKVNAKGGLLVTEYHNFVSICPEKKSLAGGPSLVLISFKGTSHKTGKKLLSLVKMRERNMYYGRYVLSVVNKSKGDKVWYEYTIDNSIVDGGWATKELAAAGKLVHAETQEMIKTLDAARIDVDPNDIDRDLAAAAEGRGTSDKF